MSGRITTLRPEFVDFMPDDFAEGVLYISMKYKSVQHLCCCGCKRTVVTPLSPTGWRMSFDGRAVSLRPSVGNWQKECGSHYFITDNAVDWARRWTHAEIAEGLRSDVQEKVDYYADPDSEIPAAPSSRPPAFPSAENAAPTGLWQKLRKIFSVTRSPAA